MKWKLLSKIEGLHCFSGRAGLNHLDKGESTDEEREHEMKAGSTCRGTWQDLEALRLCRQTY